MQKEMLTLKQIQAILKELQENNPYPADIFPKIPCTKENLLNRREALFGAEGRRVYNMALDDVMKAVLEANVPSGIYE